MQILSGSLRPRRTQLAQRPGQQQCDPQRIPDGEVFRGELAENDVEKSDPDEGKRDGDGRNQRVRMDVDERERGLEQLGKKLLAHPAERETGQRNTELSRGKVSVEMGADMLGKRGAKISVSDKWIELAAAHFDDRELARHEEPIQHHQRENYGQLAQNDGG